MTTTTPLPEATQKLVQGHLTSPAGVQNLQTELRTTLYTDASGRISVSQQQVRP